MKRLTLVNPLGESGDRTFTEGDNCETIQELPHGGYRIIRGTREDTVSAARVDHFTHLPRAGLTREPEPPAPKPERNGLSPPPAPGKLPKGVEPSGDAAEPWRCIACGLRSATVHGLKVHFARKHG